MMLSMGYSAAIPFISMAELLLQIWKYLLTNVAPICIIT